EELGSLLEFGDVGGAGEQAGGEEGVDGGLAKAQCAGGAFFVGGAQPGQGHAGQRCAEGDSAGGVESAAQAAGADDVQIAAFCVEDGGGGGNAPVPEKFADALFLGGGAQGFDADPGGSAGAGGVDPLDAGAFEAVECTGGESAAGFFDDDRRGQA